MESTDVFASLYRELVLEHGRAPRHAGEVARPTHRAQASNPLCGDRVELGLRLDSAGLIAELQHRSDGCLLCVASASLMACALHTTVAAQVPARIAELRQGVATGEAGSLGELGALTGVSAHPSRHRCVLLPWEVLESALASGAVPGALPSVAHGLTPDTAP